MRYLKFLLKAYIKKFTRFFDEKEAHWELIPCVEILSFNFLYQLLSFNEVMHQISRRVTSNLGDRSCRNIQN